MARSTLSSPAWVRRTEWVDLSPSAPPSCSHLLKKTWVKDQVLQAQDRDSRVLDFPQLLTYHGRIPDHGRIHPKLKSCRRVLSKKGNHFLICWNHKTHLTRKKKKSSSCWSLRILPLLLRASCSHHPVVLDTSAVLPPLPDVGPHVKITQGTTLESPQSRWGLPSGCPERSSASFTQAAACRPRGAGRALPLQALHPWWGQPAAALCWVGTRKPRTPGARHPARSFGQLWIS